MRRLFFFFLFFLHGTSTGNGHQGISYNIVIEAIYNGDKEDAVTMLLEMQNELIILNELYN